MNKNKYRISIGEFISGSSLSESFVDVESFEEFQSYLRYKGIRKFSLLQSSRIDSPPYTFKETGLNIETFTKDHFDWLAHKGTNAGRHLKVDYQEKVDKSDWLVYEGIRKTINRFRERPFFYFSEADIHSYLQHDILQGNSELFYQKIGKYPLSLVHLEYPTNFRYQKDELLEGIKRLEMDENNKITSDKGDRGNYDLAVLNQKFIHDVNNNYSGLDEKIKHIMNKDISYPRERIANKDYNRDVIDGKHANQFQREVQFAIEMKYFHPFNARNENVLQEIIKDNEKLNIAKIFSRSYIKPINLIFCSTSSKQRRDKEQPIIDRVKGYVKNGETETEVNGRKVKRKIPKGVLNVFIESYLEGGEKKTNKPIVFYNGTKCWVGDLNWKIGVGN